MAKPLDFKLQKVRDFNLEKYITKAGQKLY